MSIKLVPQSEIYTIFDTKNPLYALAVTHPKNMCWLTTLFYASQFLGLKNNKRLHNSLSALLDTSVEIMKINEDNGAMAFPKKYELSDKFLKSKLNFLFKSVGLKIKVKKIISEITYQKIPEIQSYLNSSQQLLTIIKNIDIKKPNIEINLEVPNHVILLKQLEDLGDGTVRVVFLDPVDANYYEAQIGFHAFIQWIQYIWVLEKRKFLIFK